MTDGEPTDDENGTYQYYFEIPKELVHAAAEKFGNGTATDTLRRAVCWAVRENDTSKKND